MTEWLKVPVLKTGVGTPYRGFESHSLRHVGLTRTLGSRCAAEVFASLPGRLDKEQSLFEKLSTKLYYHRKVLAYLAKHESEAVAAGNDEERQAILDLQFTVIPIIDDLEKQLNAIEQRRSSRFIIDSSVVG